MFGVMLGVPVPQLKKIKSSCQGDIELCKIDMLQYWLDNKLVPKCRSDVILALEETDQVALAAQIKHVYLSSTTDSEEEGMVIVPHVIMTDIIMCTCVQTCSGVKCYFTPATPPSTALSTHSSVAAPPLATA